MESFSRVDIFDTKGIEYLFVIGYLLFLIIFWNVANKHEKIIEGIRKMKILTANALRIPQGLLFDRSHTWTHLGTSGEAKVGMDDFLKNVVGDIKFVPLKRLGDIIRKGEPLTRLEQGEKHVNVYSPISGKITDKNTTLMEDPEILDEYPCENGWIYKIKPDHWKTETQSYMMADDATMWFSKEIERFKDFLAGGAMKKFPVEPSMTMLQDGGEIRVRVLSELPEEVWNDFEKEFLSP